MAMRKVAPAANPDAYVAALDGWRRPLVEALRKAVRGAATFDEAIKWAARIPGAQRGTIEVRPVWEIPDSGLESDPNAEHSHDAVMAPG